MKKVLKKQNLSLYRLNKKNGIECLIASTPETRQILNDPFIYGVEYTDKLKAATARILKAVQPKYNFPEHEDQAMVLNILRGGLNFGLREALHQAYGWNKHNTAFISSQRIKDKKGGWNITEDRYRKIYLPDKANILLGDVVATGTSLEMALLRIIEIAKKEKKSINSIIFFTIGSERSEKIITKVDRQCRKYFINYKGSLVIYIEGRFGVAGIDRKMTIMKEDTDLLRSPADLAPEFASSQDKHPTAALERCVIYDAGSRAFHVKTYLKDVKNYWQEILDLTKQGITYEEYLKERYPETTILNFSKNLETLAKKQLNKK
ncbi:hypothetical protein KKC88_00275 [Patescibacteria group bacterium]|nr:hypothetical protein [Patescibacteria group bacterium]MBU1673428.1 hypothetical protein [Patescibacteria group bacterium]MBU1963371.1 hypothetical protein [Patescibacteria group bacterium]